MSIDLMAIHSNVDYTIGVLACLIIMVNIRCEARIEIQDTAIYQMK